MVEVESFDSFIMDGFCHDVWIGPEDLEVYHKRKLEK